MNCYVFNPRAGYPLPEGVNKQNTLFYPEQSMTMQDQFHTSKPKDYHILTDSPFLVPLYDKKEVFIWDKEGEDWRNPDFQTYACSFNYIIMELFDYSNTIPQGCIDFRLVTNCMGKNRK